LTVKSFIKKDWMMTSRTCDFQQAAPIDRLKASFPRLTAEHQTYVLGQAEGLRAAQERREACGPPDKADERTAERVLAAFPADFRR
jgi:hypothetical protein